jgi:PhoH-like ATPase
VAKKSFVLDTNVLLHNPAALTSFADNEVVIPIDVIEELDRFKARDDTLGLNARVVVRHLDALRGQGSLSQGVPIPQTGGTLRVDLQVDGEVPAGLRPDRSDNRIIGVAYRLFRAGVHTVFVSKDMNARIKSDALGIRTMDFEKQKVDFDNLAFLLHQEAGPKRVSVDRRINELLSGQQLELEAMTYIRGRSIPHQYILVDEAQNLTPHEVKTIISRAGEGSKVVLTGDAYQIDNPYLDSASNGLAYSAERFRGQPLAGHVTLERSERSTLASLAAELL